MKKCLSLLLAVLLLTGAALAEGFTPAGSAVTIDSVRAAFFDAEGNYLSPMVKDGEIYVPVLGLCEALGKTAQVQGQSVTVDGVRVAMFDAAGHFVTPTLVNGADYVPLLPFCEAVGVTVTVENGAAQISREGAAEEKAQEPEHPEYVRIPLTDWNFWDYFRASITAENFKNYETKTKYGYQTLEFQHWSVDYVLTCTALTPYKFENVRFTATRNGNPNLSKYGVRKVTFSGQTMPQSGQLRQVKPYDDTYMAYSSYFSGNNLFETDFTLVLLERDASVQNVSGNILIPWAEAQEMLEGKYQSALTQMENKNYQAAVDSFKYLTEYAYKDAAQRLPEAKKALAEQKAQKQQDDYAAAQAALESGDFDAAIKGFKALGDYSDSQAKLAEANDKKYAAQYEEAVALENSGKYDEAIAIYNAMKGYQDSAQRAAACEEAKELAEKTAAYAAAEALETAGDYIGAYDAFIALGNFENSTERATKIESLKTYQQIDKLMAEGEYAQAQTLLEPLSHEEKAQQLIRTCNLRGLGTLLGFNADGTSWVEINEKDEKGQNNGVKKFALIDIQGNLLLPPETYDLLNTAWKDGLSLARKPLGLYGYLNTKGEMAIPAQYLYAQAFHQGAALVRTQAKQYQVIDTQGQVLAELPDKKGRDYISYVGEGLVTFKEKGKVGLLNLKGKVVLKPKYDRSISQFNHGMAIVTGLQKKLIAYGVINAKGKEVIKLGKFNPDVILSENLISVKGDIKKKDGVINTKGKVVLDQQYKYARRSGDLIIAKKSGVGAMDLNLKTVVPFSYGDVTVGYQSKVVMLKKDVLYNIYSISDLKKPLIEGVPYTARLSVDSPYITWYDNDLGWFVYDSEGNLIH